MGGEEKVVEEEEDGDDEDDEAYGFYNKEWVNTNRTDGRRGGWW